MESAVFVEMMQCKTHLHHPLEDICFGNGRVVLFGCCDLIVQVARLTERHDNMQNTRFVTMKVIGLAFNTKAVDGKQARICKERQKVL